MKGSRNTAGTRAAARFARWRANDVPMVVTMDEAYHLTAGAVGTAGDHTTTINLSTVARKATK